MAENTVETQDTMLQDILNELDITFHDESFEKKINAIMKRGKKYLSDKYGSDIDFEKDEIAMELLVSYCRYGRSNAIEQFKHDFASDLTALAIRGAMDAPTSSGQQEAGSVIE